ALREREREKAACGEGPTAEAAASALPPGGVAEQAVLDLLRPMIAEIAEQAAHLDVPEATRIAMGVGADVGHFPAVRAVVAQLERTLAEPAHRTAAMQAGLTDVRVRAMRALAHAHLTDEPAGGAPASPGASAAKAKAGRGRKSADPETLERAIAADAA